MLQPSVSHFNYYSGNHFKLQYAPILLPGRSCKLIFSYILQYYFIYLFKFHFFLPDVLYF